MEDFVVESGEPGRGLLVVPGISSGPFGSPFDEVADGFDGSVVRVDAWDGAADLEEMSLKDLHDLVQEGVDLLRDEGCESVAVLGKSFGGQLVLTCPDVSFECMVLWAPAVGFGEDNVEKWRSTLLGQASTATDISISEERLKDIDAEVSIFHGTEDEVVDIDTSRKIADAVSDGEITEVEGTGHSFSGVEAWLAEKSLKEIRE